MKNDKKWVNKLSMLSILVILPMTLFGGSNTVYEDAESGLNTNWSVFTNTAGIISNVEDIQKGSRVITFTGDGLNDGYMIGATRGTSAWRNTLEKNLRWSMKYSENVAIYVKVITSNGARTLLYTNSDTDRGLTRGNIHHGLGVNSTDGTWKTFNRDLEADLRDVESANSIVSVLAFMIRGSGSIDDLALVNNTTVYEDAEDGLNTRWQINMDTLGTAVVSNSNDSTKNSKVIQFMGAGLDDAYMLGHTGGSQKWNNTTEKTLKWSMNFSEDVNIYVALNTVNGERYLKYTNADVDNGLDRGNIHHGLGSGVIDGTWKTFTRDLEADLREFDSSNTITAVNAFIVRGSGMVDDISLSSNDVDKPVITLSGNTEVVVSLGNTYTEAGATANDPQDGDISSSIVTVSSVNTNLEGTYMVKYNVVDSDGVWANQITRKVIVIDPMVNHAPTVNNITMLGTASVGSILTLEYTFNDIDGDAEGTPVIAWSTPTVELQRDSSLTFTVPSGYEGDTIGAFIIVQDENGLVMDGFGYADNNYLTITAPQ